jgi:ribosomal protein S20
MPIIKSAIKRARQTIKRRKRNVLVKTAIKKDIRAVMDAVEAKDAAKTTEAFRAAVSEIDRAVKKGTLHKNTAARRKSRLAATIKNDVKLEAKPKKPAAKKKAPAKKTTKK